MSRSNHPRRPSDQHDLLESTEMRSLTSRKQPSTSTAPYTDEPLRQTTSVDPNHETSDSSFAPVSSSVVTPDVIYRTYKIRWFGLLQLTLLNIIVSWDWLTYAPVSKTASEYFQVRVSTIDWLSTAFLFAFVAASPLTIYILNHGGPTQAIKVASSLIFVGNWIRYAGARADGSVHGTRYGVTMVGQVMIGFAQPFVLAAPTRYSDMWFQEKGRIAATALASLANPFGGALGQLIDPLWATKASDIPNMVLYVAIISTVASIPSFFIPNHPPTPPTPTSTTAIARTPLNLATLRALVRNPSFLILAASFMLLVSCFNAVSSLLVSIMDPYGYSEDASGLTGALLIIVGLLTSAVTSPILDRHHSLRLPVLKIFVFVLAPLYTAFIFAPATRTLPAPYIIGALIGAASFSLVPLALESLVEVTKPISPEVSSVVCWSGGQLGGACAILAMDGLRGSWGQGEPGENMKGGLVLLAVVAWIAVPGPMVLGWWRGTGIKSREGLGGEM